MNKTKTLILSLSALVLCFAMPAFAQTFMSTTTLSSAITTPTASVSPSDLVYVASATNMVAGQTLIYVDNEAMTVTAISGTTLTVFRGYQSQAHIHASGALVWYGPANNFFSQSALNTPSGQCTRSAERVIPYINLSSGIIADCLGGTWVYGTMSPLPPFRVLSPEPGGTAYSTLNTAGTTLAATTMYCTELNLHENKLLTGLAVLNGTTVGTDNHLVALYDASGNLLANSAVAGVLSATASVYQQIAFTSKFYAIGPAQYFACMQTNGTTATVRMAVTGTDDNVLTKGVTAQTFGTIPLTITVPTTFTTAVGPYWYAY